MLVLQARQAPKSVSDGFAQAIKPVTGWIDGFFSLLPNLAVAFATLLLFVALAYGAGGLVSRSFRKRNKHDLAAMLAGLAFWFVVVAGALISLTIILPNLNPADLVASLGIGTIAIGFAFKDILQNWLAGILILFRQPFRRGDQIRVGDKEGIVRRITSRALYLKTYDGRRIIIPNAEVYSSAVTVHTAYPQRRVTLDLTIGYDYDFRTVSRIISAELADISEVLDDPPPQIFAWDLGSTSLGVRVRWWIEPQRAQEISSRARVVQAIKEAFQANDIDPTDPQLIFYQNAAPSGMPRQDDEATREGKGPAAPADSGRPGALKRAAPIPPVAGDPDDPESEQPLDEPTEVESENPGLPVNGEQVRNG